MSKLEAVSITKSFGDNTILQDVSLRLEPREIVCLLGVSGGGKTTLFNVLSGLTLPDRGRYSWTAGRSPAKPGTSAICCKRTC